MSGLSMHAFVKSELSHVDRRVALGIFIQLHAVNIVQVLLHFQLL